MLKNRRKKRKNKGDEEKKNKDKKNNDYYFTYEAENGEKKNSVKGTQNKEKKMVGVFLK